MTIRAFAAILFVAAPALADVAAEDPFVRAVPEGVRASAAYMVLRNAGEADDTLIAADAPIAARVELHTHILEDGVARMREIDGGIPVPAGEEVTLEPGGLHVMLMGLSAPLVAGETASFTLIFESGARLEVDAPIKATEPMRHGGHDHGDGHGHGHDHGG